MRIDLDIINGYIKKGSHVLDLGCGDGTVLDHLRTEKNITGVGIENDGKNIGLCIEKNIAVVEHDLNKGLGHFDSNSYDVVIMTLALQALQQPDEILEEMLRIGKECIVTFPNFAHWKVRWDIGVRGRMPVSDFLPYQWYNTPNIHFCTIRDFEVLCRERNIAVLHRDVVNNSRINKSLSQLFPNLFGETAIYRLTNRW